MLIIVGKKCARKNPDRSTRGHSRRPRGNQSGREKRRDESFQVRAKEPLVTDSHRTISKNSSRCRFLIGHKNRRTHLLSSFRVLVHDGYCLDHGLSGSCTKEMQAVRKLSVWYKPPSDFKLLSARKLKDAFPKTTFSSQQVFTVGSATSLRKCICREFCSRKLGGTVILYNELKRFVSLNLF